MVVQGLEQEQRAVLRAGHGVAEGVGIVTVDRNLVAGVGQIDFGRLQVLRSVADRAVFFGRVDVGHGFTEVGVLDRRQLDVEVVGLDLVELLDRHFADRQLAGAVVEGADHFALRGELAGSGFHSGLAGLEDAANFRRAVGGQSLGLIQVRAGVAQVVEDFGLLLVVADVVFSFLHPAAGLRELFVSEDVELCVVTLGDLGVEARDFVTGHGVGRVIYFFDSAGARAEHGGHEYGRDNTRDT